MDRKLRKAHGIHSLGERTAENVTRAFLFQPNQLNDARKTVDSGLTRIEPLGVLEQAHAADDQLLGFDAESNGQREKIDQFLRVRSQKVTAKDASTHDPDSTDSRAPLDTGASRVV